MFAYFDNICSRLIKSALSWLYTTWGANNCQLRCANTTKTDTIVCDRLVSPQVLQDLN